MGRVAKALLAVVVLVAGAVPVYSLCRPAEASCGLQCGELGGGLYCIERADSNHRACWASGTGNVCAEDAIGCDCGGFGEGGF